MRSFTLVLLLGVVATAGPSAAAPPQSRGVVLIGLDWIGLWRDGRVVASHDEPNWAFQAARLSADKKTIEVVAYADHQDRSATVTLHFDARTLAPGPRTTDRAAGDWPTLVTPIDPDPRAPDATASNGALVAIRSAGGLVVKPRAGGVAHPLPGGTWRMAVSPDGSTAAAFAKPSAAHAPWRGRAWNTRTGRRIVAPGLTIDDGARRDNNASRGMGCLLPDGAGAIFTYVGAPADRWSEYQAFGARAGKPVELKTSYVMACIIAE